jgi:hypothetical protein
MVCKGQGNKSGRLLTFKGKKRLNSTEIAYHRIEEEFSEDKNDIHSMQIPFHLQPLTSAHQTKLLHWNLLLDTNHQYLIHSLSNLDYPGTRQTAVRFSEAQSVVLTLSDKPFL